MALVTKGLIKMVMTAYCAIMALLPMVLSQSSDPGTLNFALMEDQGPGTPLGDIFEQANLNDKYTSDQLQSLEFSFLNDDYEGMFRIINGKLETAVVIDRDILCPYKSICTLDLDVKVNPTEYFQIIKIMVEVLDQNDHAPTFPSAVVNLSIKESASIGALLPIPEAEDTDSPLFGVQQYNLLTQSDTWELKVTNNDDGSREVAFSLLRQVDRESRDTYNLELQAIDGGEPPKEGRVSVNIRILDVNDNSPIFENQTYSVVINEDEEPGTPILTVKAKDKDLKENAVISYKLAEKTRQAYKDIFKINSTTGTLYVMGEVDYELNPVYVLTIEAKDNNPDAVPATARVTVTLRDSNDNPPSIKLNLDDAGRTIQLSEYAAIGDFVAHITVEDLDSGSNGEFDCTLNTDVFSLKRLYPTEFKIITAAQFDREMKGVYDIYINCTDKGSPAQTSRLKLTINIKDENDNVPKFLSASYGGSVLEHSPAGALVVQVRAIDKDIGFNQRITYSLDEAAKSLFNIDQITGNITTKAELDHEQISRVQFKVLAIDQGSPALTGTANVVVDVIDIDDEKPEFLQDSYTFAVYENGNAKQDAKQEIGQVEAHDKDSELFNQFVYRLQDTKGGIFSIDSDTGIISTNIRLDREQMPKYNLVALAVGKGLRPQSSSATVTVYVADENDHKPEIIFPTEHNNTVYISNKARLGTVITRVEAKDKDTGVNAQLEFSILSGNSDHFFALDKHTGIITVHQEFNGIENQAFGLVVQVQDGGQIPHHEDAFLNIIVNKSITPSGDVDTLMTNHNLKIVIAIACVAGVIMVVLLIAIVAIVRQQRVAAQDERKYNHIPKVLERNALNNANDQDGKKKKEVSFDNAAMETGNCNDSFTIQKQNKDNSMADDTDSACSIDMSNADSGRGSNDEYSPSTPGGDHVNHDNIIPNTTDGIPIRTGGLDPGSYYSGPNHSHRDISKLFTRDILYRDNVQGTAQAEERPPKIPERAPRSTHAHGRGPAPPRGHVYAPNGDLYTTPAFGKSSAARLPSDSSSSHSSCPVHSPVGKGRQGHSQYPNGYTRKQNLPMGSSVKEDVSLEGVIDSEIHV